MHIKLRSLWRTVNVLYVQPNAFNMTKFVIVLDFLNLMNSKTFLEQTF